MTTTSAPTPRSRRSAAPVEAPVEITSSTMRHAPAVDVRDARPVEEQTLVGVGRDGAHRLADRVGQVDLGRLVQDHVLVEPRWRVTSTTIGMPMVATVATMSTS